MGMKFDLNGVDELIKRLKKTQLEVVEEVAPKALREAAKVVSARIKVRYDKNINAKMRIIFRDELYAIQGVTPDNESGLQWMTIFVTQGTSVFNKVL